VDVLFIADRYAFSWEDILVDAKEKDLWVEPIEICRVIESFPSKLLSAIKWIQKCDISRMTQMTRRLRDDIFYGNDNSLISFMPSME
jgi:hypothetical protein